MPSTDTSSRPSSNLPLHLIAHFVLTFAMVWAMVAYLPQYLSVTGGWVAFIIVAALLTLMNILVRPILSIITLPLKFFANILAIILVNGVFMWLTMQAVSMMDPRLISVSIEGGITGWVVVALVLGFGHWIIKIILR